MSLTVVEEHPSATGASRLLDAAGYRWLDPDGMESYSGIPKSSLAKMRLTGGGCRYVKIGRRVRYRTDWVDAWLEAGTRKSTSDSGAVAA